MGRLPLHRRPRRRRARADQPPGTPVHPLLPRARSTRCGRRCPSGASSTARSSIPDGRRPRTRLRRPAPAHPPGRVAGPPPGRRDAERVRRLRPAGARRRVVARPAVPRPRAELALLDVVPANEAPCSSRRRAPTRPSRPTGSRAFEGAGLDGVVAKPARRACTSPTSGRWSRSSTSAPPTAWSPGSASTRTATASGRCCSACSTTTSRLNHVGVAAAFTAEYRTRAARRADAADRGRRRRPPVGRVGRDAATARRRARAGDRRRARRRAATSRRHQPVERRQGPVVGAGAGRAGGRGDVRPARERPVPPRRLVRALAPGPRSGRAVATTSSTSPIPMLVHDLVRQPGSDLIRGPSSRLGRVRTVASHRGSAGGGRPSVSVLVVAAGSGGRGRLPAAPTRRPDRPADPSSWSTSNWVRTAAPLPVARVASHLRTCQMPATSNGIAAALERSAALPAPSSGIGWTICCPTPSGGMERERAARWTARSRGSFTSTRRLVEPDPARARGTPRASRPDAGSTIVSCTS